MKDVYKISTVNKEEKMFSNNCNSDQMETLGEKELSFRVF